VTCPPAVTCPPCETAKLPADRSARSDLSALAVSQPLANLQTCQKQLTTATAALKACKQRTVALSPKVLQPSPALPAAAPVIN
jgi:hypothetical protein